MTANAALVIGIIALAIATIALIISVIGYREQRASRTSPALRAPRTTLTVSPLPDDAPAVPDGPAAFIVNPIKVTDVTALENLARLTARELGMPEPLVYRTTAEDPGVGQARSALEAGASVVVAAGGDGTVRAVAEALAGTNVPMALIPAGTGNLLARNLDLPVDGLPHQVRTALSGRDMAMDLGWLTARPPAGDEPTDDEIASGSPAPEREHLFLVMAGLGFDAAMVAGADDDLKRRVGWVAYFLVGVRHLHARRTRLSLRIGNGGWDQQRVRTLLFANCGRLPGGIVLLPDAELDDGYLDVAAIDTRGGLIGWASLLWRVLLQGLGWRSSNVYNPSRIDFWRARTVSVRLEEPHAVQVDGDLIGDAIALRVRIQPDGLRVRVRR
ncbi:diacylglycerol/lipid kinase family protein [Serinibacter arcticus]|uniref:diacylglycerol/lipid kinase family protein n=1 Tax=Serinibacter arcticus TaxID=1655435 RepID=UPI001F3B1FAD|nr:diacylglycerol kinase family protein [Serinibacter arcticus]